MKNELTSDELRLILETKAQFFRSNQIPVHIKFKEGFWKRGLIKEVHADFFILEENLEGDMMVFFIEIKDLEEWRKVK